MRNAFRKCWDGKSVYEMGKWGEYRYPELGDLNRLAFAGFIVVDGCGGLALACLKWEGGREGGKWK